MSHEIFGRAASALGLTILLALLFWVAPDFGPDTLGIQTPRGVMWLFTTIFGVLFVYLLIQGWPISHGNIGSSSTHNLDNIVSGIPAMAALFGYLVHFADFWPLSSFNLLVAFFVILTVIFDLWVLGGSASKINRLTNDFRSER